MKPPRPPHNVHSSSNTRDSFTPAKISTPSKPPPPSQNPPSYPQKITLQNVLVINQTSRRAVCSQAIYASLAVVQADFVSTGNFGETATLSASMPNPRNTVMGAWTSGDGVVGILGSPGPAGRGGYINSRSYFQKVSILHVTPRLH